MYLQKNHPILQTRKKKNQREKKENHAEAFQLIVLSKNI